MFSWVRHLTVSTPRLNSRDYVRDRLANASDGIPDNAFNLSSIRIEPLSDAHGSETGQPDVSVTVHSSTGLNFGGRNKSDYNVEPTFEVPKPVRYLHFVRDSQINTYLSAGCKYLPFAKPRSNIGVERVGSRRDSREGTADRRQRQPTGYHLLP